MNLEKRIRIVPYEKVDAGFSMAIDNVLLNMMENDIEEGKSVDPVLRIYSFSSPTVVLGYNQKIEGRFNQSLAIKKRVNLTIRDSGGGHMYFSPEDVHFSFISPGKGFYAGFDLIARYHEINSVISQALKNLGYNSVLGKTSIRLEGDPERFVAGTAIRQKNNAYLHQGGILINDYDNEVFSLLMARPDEIEKWKTQVTSLKKNGDKNILKLPEMIISNFKNYYLKPLTREEESYAQLLDKERYSNYEVILSGTKEGDICLIAGEKSDKNKEERVNA